ncbi:3-phenylpropionate/trans-cinnamate dioxygenase ferredoxin subunit [Herbihabitans rhizosphaerae]|uniref:3-phenylpropionate/trans-cinnamate dioxygenase ferredoxin subunit n=1 Tax=Herbihabitans rhizosphaerae TaxID=1872711 RepID=A0A4Q7L2A1_9PSEU|nr:Rieske 2Fe-2S domain-containing protein [Herbihabitans rhizosphaerae]RZS43337.1 3-phenylpropionate/trans-cinnamate dioxygenase ferredoxin subunit [Herbihabitans rhizosphaerae]
MTRACALSELDDRKPLAVQVDDVDVVLVRDGDTVHALRDECSHAELSLSEGEVTKNGIECWLHGSCFDLRTGAPSSPPATEKVDVYAVSIVDDDVHVDVATVTN